MLFPLLYVCVALVERLNPELIDVEGFRRWCSSMSETNRVEVNVVWSKQGRRKVLRCGGPSCVAGGSRGGVSPGLTGVRGSFPEEIFKNRVRF